MAKANKIQDKKEVSTAAKSNEAVNMEGLEKDAAPMTKHAVSDEEANKFADVDFLTKENPADYHIDENISSKYDKEREDKVYLGLELIKNIVLASGKNVNPLLILLGKWWEVKPARAGIKKLIDAEAALKGFPSDVYMQIELKKEIDALAELQTAVDRMRYTVTYFKPRKALSNKVLMTQIKIDNVLYNVPTAALAEAKEKFADDKAGLKAHVLTIAIPTENIVEEL